MWNEGNGQGQQEFTEALFDWAAKKDAAERERRNAEPQEVKEQRALNAAERMMADLPETERSGIMAKIRTGLDEQRKRMA